MTKFFMLPLLLVLHMSVNGGNNPLLLASNQVCVGSSTLLSEIIITESAASDFNIIGSGTIILEANSGSFGLGGGETVTLSGSASVTASIVVSASQVVITLNESNNNNDSELNSISIKGLKFIAPSATEYQVVYAPASTIAINGMSPGTKVADITGNTPPTATNTGFIECSGRSLNYNLQNNIGNGVPSNFMWVAANNPNVTGESTVSKYSTYLNDTIINKSGVAQNLIYTITPTGFTAGCQGNSYTLTVTINPTPDVIITNNTPVISNGGTTNISLSSSMPTVAFIYTVANPVEITGATGGAGNLIIQTLTNSGGQAQPVQYSITGTSVVGCQSDNKVAYVQVNGFQSVSSSDSLALVAFYNSTNGPSWSNQINPWLIGAVNTWLGVTVSAFRVTEVSLPEMNVTGFLPPELGDLTALTSFEVINVTQGVGLNGTVPSQIANLTNLTTLRLSGNNFTAFPSEVLTLTNLTTLELSRNGFMGTIPNALGNLINLTELDLSGDKFTGTIPDLSTITGPVAINLEHNELTSLPNVSTWNFNLLEIGYNQLTFEDLEPIQGIANMSYNNQKPLGNVQNVKLGRGETFTASFTVGGSANQYQWIKGVEPMPGGNSNSISIGDVSPVNNGVYKLRITNSTVPTVTLFSQPIFLTVSSVFSVDSLAAVALFNSTGGASWVNKEGWLSAPLETWQGLIFGDGRITEINLPDNNLTGTLPVDIGNLAELTKLDLGGSTPYGKSTNPNRNKIGGSIPGSLNNLVNLNYLNLSSNELTGTLPAVFSSLVNLTELSLTANKLKLGNFPSPILSMTNLASLKLSSCGITGAIPAAFQNMVNLQSLILNDNQITNIPLELASLPILYTLYLNNNLITDIPDFSTLPVLTEAHVQANKLTFEDLEYNTDVGPLTYVPQDSVGVKNQVLLLPGASHTISTSVGGTSNQYQWNKDGVAIAGATGSSFIITSADISKEGSYVYEVTSPLVPGLTLISRPVNLKISSLKRDSLALVHIYNATNGKTWTNKAGWLTGKLSTWFGVTITANRVSDIKLNNNNLNGAIPLEIIDIANLKTVDISTNKITGIPDLSPLTKLTSFNVSGNKLDFGSLESNKSLLAKISYLNQANFGMIIQDSVQVKSYYAVSIFTPGVNNLYQWKKNNIIIPGATLPTFFIESLDKTNMGTYICTVTNPTVPSLVLTSLPQTVLAVTDLTGILFAGSNNPATKGTVTLLKITQTGGYDTLGVQKIDELGNYKFNKVVLDDYQLLAFADTLTYVKALPTYYSKTIFWEEAETISITKDLNISYDVMSEFKPSPSTGTGVIKGILEEELGDNGGRVKGKGRVENAGVCARRVESGGRTKDDVLTLAGYVFTNENGEFEINHLTPGIYRLNIQYPGYPMDGNSFISIPIGLGDASQVQVEATVAENKISVRQLVINGIEDQQDYMAEVYPVPSKESVKIKFASQASSRKVEMMDLMGRRIQMANANEKQISLDVRSLPQGMYLLDIRDKNKSVKKVRIVVD